MWHNGTVLEDSPPNQIYSSSYATKHYVSKMCKDVEPLDGIT
jgi:hypothetical protein